MKFPILFLIGAVLFAGCDAPAVHSKYMTMDELKANKKFLGYEILEIRPQTEGMNLEGPFKLAKKRVNSTIQVEGRTPMKRQIPVGEADYVFEHEDSVGYGFRFISIENAKGEWGIAFLKTKKKPLIYAQKRAENVKAAKDRAKKKGAGGAPSADRILDRLKESDKDGDGKLAKDEVSDRIKDRFDSADENSDGFIDEAEMKKMAESIGGGGGSVGAIKSDDDSDDKDKADSDAKNDGEKPDEEK